MRTRSPGFTYHLRNASPVFFFFFNLLLNCSIFQSAVDATSITPPIREFMDNANGDHQRAEDESLG